MGRRTSGATVKKMTQRTKQEEVDLNFQFFQSEVAKLLTTHRGKFALIHDRKIIGFYDTALDAYTSGNQLYSDGLFSIQQVTENAADLGFYSHPVPLGTT
jgi:hypothetical protein